MKLQDTFQVSNNNFEAATMVAEKRARQPYYQLLDPFKYNYMTIT